MMEAAAALLDGRDFSWSSLSTELLRAELARRKDDDADSRPQCGSGQRGEYDTFVHVAALVLILILSTLSCAFPLLGRRSRGRRHGNIVFLCQHFGTGVLIATAFVHLLPHAFMALTDPCLPPAFSKGYTPLAGLIAMTSALAVFGLESYLTTRGAGHTHAHDLWDDSDSDTDADGKPFAAAGGSMAARRGELSHRPRRIALEDLEASEGLVAGISPLPGSTPVTAQASDRTNGTTTAAPAKATDRAGTGDDDDSIEGDSADLDLSADELSPACCDDDAQSQQPLTSPQHQQPSSHPSAAKSPGGLLLHNHHHRPAPSVPHIPDPEEQRRLLLQCLLLEAGILFHSIFIGMALSVATGETFAVFLLAIALHQSFEGLALGSRIAAIHFPARSPRPWLMVLAYGVMTPVGQAVGLFIHNVYDPRSQGGLIVVGFVNAISSGMLLFAGLVQLLAEDFLSEKSYRTLHGSRRLYAFLAVLGGAGLMAALRALVM